MTYKGYKGHANYNAEGRNFYGTVLGINDVVTFVGTTVDELEQAFQDSVDDYLEMCEEMGRKPQKPRSGKFVLRLSPRLHHRVALEAKRQGVSMNRFIVDALMAALRQQAAVEK